MNTPIMVYFVDLIFYGLMARGIGEYGVIGMAGALGNALSIAVGVELIHLAADSRDDLARGKGWESLILI